MDNEVIVLVAFYDERQQEGVSDVEGREKVKQREWKRQAEEAGEPFVQVGNRHLFY